MASTNGGEMVARLFCALADIGNEPFIQDCARLIANGGV